jgi:hypothetical protein
MFVYLFIYLFILNEITETASALILLFVGYVMPNSTEQSTFIILALYSDRKKWRRDFQFCVVEQEPNLALSYLLSSL